ncbi:hypothetical protein DL351_03045 [Pseudomonas aeruginosa]|nr:hypothetical protein DL351_03045 [Pseudomonas aeruginosa]MCO3298354.1 hypothetical protein [Pseudomonas aeruginosa]MDV6800084.1 hypothetical protein [Pseudomonas aeruginosa]
MAVFAPNAQATASIGAPSNFISAWPQHWNQIESQVKRLQVRIANSPCVSVSQAARVAVSHAERLPCITS